MSLAGGASETERVVVGQVLIAGVRLGFAY